MTSAFGQKQDFVEMIGLTLWLFNQHIMNRFVALSELWRLNTFIVFRFSYLIIIQLNDESWFS